MSKTKTTNKKKSSGPKTKGAAKKNKAIGKSKQPKAQNAAMKAGLDAVAAIPVGKDSKLALVVKLLSRSQGATLEDVMAETGWLKHTVRSCISHALAKKRNYKIASEKPPGGVRIYKIVTPETAKH